MLGRREIEALKYRHIARQSTFRPQHSSVIFSENKADTKLGKVVNSLKFVSQAVLGGGITHPHATKETSRLIAQATQLTSISTAPPSNSERVWSWFSFFCSKHGVDPWSASDGDICLFIIARAKETASLAMVEGDLKTVLSFRKNAGTSMGNVPFPS